MTQTPEELTVQIDTLDARLNALESRLRGGADGQAKLLREFIESARNALAARKKAILEARHATASQAHVDDAMEAHAGELISRNEQTAWLDKSVSEWELHRDRSGPDLPSEAELLRERYTELESRFDAIAVAVRPRPLRDGTGTQIAGFAVDGIATLFKCRQDLLEFEESAPKKRDEIERFLAGCKREIKEQEDRLRYLDQRLAEWHRGSR